MKHETKAVVLAAGKSTRMKSDTSKIVHRILGKEVINFLLDSLVESGVREEDIIMVVDPQDQSVKDAINRNVRYAVQKEKLGTAHALLCAGEFIENFAGDIIVTVGDNPFITPADFRKLVREHRKSGSDCTFITAVYPDQPPPYGRILRDHQNQVSGIVEERDATENQLKIKEVNASIYMFANQNVFPLLRLIKNENQKKEYYLTDIIHILKNNNRKISTVIADDYFVSFGINTRWDLQEAQKVLNERNLKFLAFEKGVTILQPDSVTIECHVEIGRDSVVYPFSYIAGKTIIGKNCQIGPFAYLKDTIVNDNSKICFEKQTGEKKR
jgi:bifunctional UDP-N-acetylglucosamine pyrophosphorylase/glucosamine-1-phosphate N-acetyltransferase